MATRKYIELRDNLRIFYLRTQRHLDRLTAPFGSTAVRMTFLVFVAENDGVRSADIIKTFSLSPRTVTETIDQMEKDGYVKRMPDPRDRRAKILKVTASGERLLAKLEPIREGFNDRLFGALSRAEQTQLTALLSKLNDRLGLLDDEADSDVA